MLNIEIIYSGTDSASLTQKRSYSMNSPAKTNWTFSFTAHLYTLCHQEVNWE